MGWSNEEQVTTKKGMDLSSKILITIIAFVILIIILITVLLFNIQSKTFKITVNGQSYSAADTLITKIDDVSYINIEEFAKLVGYEYHQGEYKKFTIEENKCYVKGKNETATFFANDNKVCKLLVDKLTDDYDVYTIENTIKKTESGIYAPTEAIGIAFNVVIELKEKSLEIITLDNLVTTYNTKVQSWGYSEITDQSFENSKSILYGYLIVKKPDSNLYKIINLDNSKEIVADKYNSIQFIEKTQEFFVTNSLGEFGIINLDGTTKIEPEYESIEVLSKELDLYLIQKEGLYGVVKSGNVSIVYPQYESIGIDYMENYDATDSKYLLLDKLIPVYKDDKYGAYDTQGNLIYKLEYDGFGCEAENIEVNGIKKEVESVLTIKRCEGVVVQKGEKYGVLDLKGNVLVPISVDSIYGLKTVQENDEDSKYFMFYNNKELNVIERLIKAGKIKEKEVKPDDKPNNNQVENTVQSNTIQTNQAATTNNTITVQMQ